jgi:hypothetical protein
MLPVSGTLVRSLAFDISLTTDAGRFDAGLSRSIEAVLGPLFVRELEVDGLFDEPAASQTREQVAGRLREKIRRHMATEAHPRLADLQGRSLTADDFPLTGDGLEPGTALAILERLEERIQENPSAGHLAACLLEHVRYGVGSGTRLSPVQVRFIKSVCTLTNRRPLPFLRLREFILANLEAPQKLRMLLTTLLDDKDGYLDKLRVAVGRQIATAGLPPAPHVGVFGYASSLAVVLAEIAKASGGRMHLHIASVPRAGRRPAPDDALRLALRRAAVEYVHEEVNLEDSPASAGRLDLALAGTKVISASASGSLEIINSSPCVEFLQAIRRHSPKTRIAVATGLFKIWPVSFYARHRELALRLERSGPKLANAALAGEVVDSVVSELGWLAPRDFVAHWKVSRLLRAEDVLSFAKVLASRSEEVARAFDGGHAGVGGGGYADAGAGSGFQIGNVAVLEPRPLGDGAARKEYARAVAHFKERCADAGWLSAYRGRFVAVRGTEPPEEIYGEDYFDVMTKVSAQWPASAVFASRI